MMKDAALGRHVYCHDMWERLKKNQMEHFCARKQQKKRAY
ncbi:unnamed protein product [Rhodiola kirilowii]